LSKNTKEKKKGMMTITTSKIPIPFPFTENIHAFTLNLCNACLPACLIPSRPVGIYKITDQPVCPIRSVPFPAPPKKKTRKDVKKNPQRKSHIEREEERPEKASM
jgi:hypothetical protein